MPPPSPADAKTAYALQRALVDLALADLARALEAHEAAPLADMARVEELAEVERRLVAITALLMKGAAPGSSLGTGAESARPTH